MVLADHLNLTYNSKVRVKEMKINLWYSRGCKQWRWTLMDDFHVRHMESGNASDVDTALEDVATTIKWLMGTPVNKGDKEHPATARQRKSQETTMYT